MYLLLQKEVVPTFLLAPRSNSDAQFCPKFLSFKNQRDLLIREADPR